MTPTVSLMVEMNMDIKIVPPPTIIPNIVSTQNKGFDMSWVLGFESGRFEFLKFNI